MVFFERCVKSVSLIGDSVDRTAETQAQVNLDWPAVLNYNKLNMGSFAAVQTCLGSSKTPDPEESR